MTGQTELDEYSTIANQDVANSVSSSWAICEPDAGLAYVQAENLIFEQMAAQGQSMFSSSGDTGAFECIRDGTFSDYAPLEALDPSTQPWVTSTGGTSFGTFDPGDNPNPSYPYGIEEVWNTLDVCSGNNSSTASSTGIIDCGLYGAGGGGQQHLLADAELPARPRGHQPVHGLRPKQLRSRGDGPTVPRGAGCLGQRRSPHRLRRVLHRFDLRLAQPDRHRL